MAHVRGSVVAMRDDEAWAAIDRLSVKYVGQPYASLGISVTNEPLLISAPVR
jgi:hypothetical protein